MGPHENQLPVLYVNGAPMDYVNAIPEITLDPVDDAGEADLDSIKRDDSFSFSCKVNFWPISRKRLIRNLVKGGCPKKKAKHLAWKAHHDGMSYSNANFYYCVCGVWKVSL